MARARRQDHADHREAVYTRFPQGLAHAKHARRVTQWLRETLHFAFHSTGFTGCGKTQNVVILSEAKNLSLFLLLYLNRREILRFAQNDKIRPFFRSLFSLCSLNAPPTKTHRLKPVLLGSRSTSSDFLGGTVGNFFQRFLGQRAQFAANRVGGKSGSQQAAVERRDAPFVQRTAKGLDAALQTLTHEGTLAGVRRSLRKGGFNVAIRDAARA